MANVEQITRDYLLRARTEGVAETTAAAQRLGVATDSLATKTETQSKSAISAAAALERQQRQLDLNYRSMKQFEQAQRDLDRAQQQGLISTARHAELTALASARFQQASASQRALSTATQAWQNQVSAATGATGTLGSVIASLGGGWVALVAVAGAAILVLKGMSDASHALAEKAEELRRFSEATGLTATQIQALKVEASKFGVTSEEAQTAIQNFTARFNDLRIGQGELLTQIRRVNPALADQMAAVTNTGDALTLFGQALAKVDDVFARNALVKAATGRGGISSAQFLSNLNVDAVTKSFTDAGKTLDDALIKRVAQLEIDIKKTSSQASAAIASIFAESTLQAELVWQKQWLEFATSVKNFSISGDLRFLLETVLKIKLGGAGTLLGALGIDYEAGYKAPIIAPPRRSAPEILVPTFNTSAGSADRNDVLRQQLNPTPQYTLETLQKQIAAMGEAATIAQKFDAAQKQLAISGKEAGLSAEQMAKAENVLKGAFALQQMQATVSALGSVVTPTEQYALKLAELTQNLNRGAISQQTFNRAAAGLKQEFALQALQEMVSTLGAAATPTEQFKLKVAELEQKLASGRITLQTFNRALADFQQEQSVTGLRNNVSALGSAATAAEQYSLKVAELDLSLARGQITQDTYNRAVREANPLFQLGKQSADQFGQVLASNLQNGKGFSDSLGASLKSLSASLTSGAITSLINGDFAMAAAKGIMAIGSALASSIFGDKSADHKSLIDTLDRLNQLRLRQVTAANDNNTLAGQLAVFDASALLEQIDEARKGGELMTALIQTQSEERLKIINDFNTQAVAADKQAADARLARQQSLDDRIFAATTDTSTLEGALAAQQRDFAKERLDEQASGGLDMAKLLQAQQDEELALRKSFNDKALAATQQAEQARLDAINGAAKNIVDYLNGLQSGPGSTLAPGAVLSNAQSAYNANYALAFAGNLDAQNKFVSLADNLEKAARVVYASGQGYQDIRNQIINQGLALPAVQASTDPVVNALTQVLTAINTGNTILSGNAAAIANLLLPTMGQSLTFAQFVTGITGNTLATIDQVSRDRLQNIFSELDGNGNGILERTEAVRAATEGVHAATDYWSYPIVGNTNATSTNALTTANNVTGLERPSGTLDQIKQLNSTASQQLTLLNNNLTAAAVLHVSGSRAGQPFNLDVGAGGAIDFLRKITANTYAISLNTALLASNGNGPSAAVLVGSLASGGWITGGTPGRDSVPIMAMPDEFMVNAGATRALTSQFGSGIMDMINAGRLPSNVVQFPVPVNSGGAANDNAAVVSELRRLSSTVEAQTRTIAGLLGRIAQLEGEGNETLEGLHAQGVEAKHNRPARQVASR